MAFRENHTLKGDGAFLRVYDVDENPCVAVFQIKKSITRAFVYQLQIVVF